ncbi:MAG: UDP-N-acetylglucosamine--N-acetylmuramyl-(pentapeptide) pyrophosphoryl-undecaprenol N-acetylglucosamine transferase [Chlamydiota bacterium]
MKIVIAVGGTGGHVIPAEHLGESLIQKKHQVTYLGRKGKFFSLKDAPFYEISTSSIRSKNPFKLCVSCCKIAKGVLQSLFHIWKIKPDTIVGFGSFHTFPILLAALILKKKFVLYESNKVCGVVNRLFSKKAKYIACQFPNIEKSNCKVTELVQFLPWKNFSEVKQESKIFTVLVFGGSQGAKFINEKFPKAARLLKEKKRNFKVIHITGKSIDHAQLAKFYDSLGIENEVKPFEHNFLKTLQLADLVICRSGASTIGELICFQKPSILIPYPFATDRHQHKNGAYFAEIIKGGIMMEQHEVTSDKLCEKIDLFMQYNCQQLKIMQANIVSFYTKEKNRPSFLQLLER